jgi:CheY-like chemotaxis protein
MTGNLAGRRVLLVEDEYFIADDTARIFEAGGAEVIGPVASMDEALALVADTPRLDGAVLDINLQGEMAYLVADALAQRGVPYVFATGYDETSVPERYAAVIRCEKPVDPQKIAKALFA